MAGKAFRPRSLNLGPWRWFTFGLAVIYLFIVVVLPTLALIIAAFRKFLFFKDFDALFDMKPVQPRSTSTACSTTRSPCCRSGTRMKVGVLTAVVGGVLAFAIGYTVHRTQVAGRSSIDLLSTLPVAIPGLVVGVAYLWAWIGLPGGLYGTIWILALAFVARFIPDTVKALSTSFLQIHKELEEAAWICGRGLLGTIRTIVLPLARPGVVASMTLLFVLAIRELGLVALPLHQRHDRDGRAAARLLRGRQHRQDRRLQPGADGDSRRAAGHHHLALARGGAKQRPRRLTDDDDNRRKRR